jgi:hypothetical protein
MDGAGVEFGLLSAWHAPEGALISNDEVAAWIADAPGRRQPTQAHGAVRELRRCVDELGFKGLRVVPWLWDAPTPHRWVARDSERLGGRRSRSWIGRQGSAEPDGLITTALSDVSERLPTLRRRAPRSSNAVVRAAVARTLARPAKR